MKRFLISFIVGCTLIAAGITMTLIEFKDFEFVSELQKDEDTVTETFTINNGNHLVLDIDDYAYAYSFDDTMKDGQINVILNKDTEYKRGENTLNVYDEWGNDHLSFTNVFEKFIRGLKEHKFYTAQSYYQVQIVTNHNTVDLIKFD